MAQLKHVFESPQEIDDLEYESLKDKFKHVKFDFSRLADLDLMSSVKIDKSVRTEEDEGVYYTKNAVVYNVKEHIDVLPYIVAKDDEVFMLASKPFEEAKQRYHYEYQLVRHEAIEKYKRLMLINLETDWLLTPKIVWLRMDFDKFRRVATKKQIIPEKQMRKRRWLDRYIESFVFEGGKLRASKYYDIFARAFGRQSSQSNENQIRDSDDIVIQQLANKSNYGYLEFDKNTGKLYWCRDIRYYELGIDARFYKREETVKWEIQFDGGMLEDLINEFMFNPLDGDNLEIAEIILKPERYAQADIQNAYEKIREQNKTILSEIAIFDKEYDKPLAHGLLIGSLSYNYENEYAYVQTALLYR